MLTNHYNNHINKFTISVQFLSILPLTAYWSLQVLNRFLFQKTNLLWLSIAMTERMLVFPYKTSI